MIGLGVRYMFSRNALRMHQPQVSESALVSNRICSIAEKVFSLIVSFTSRTIYDDIGFARNAVRWVRANDRSRAFLSARQNIDRQLTLERFLSLGHPNDYFYPI